MGPTSVLSAPGGPHVGPMDLAISVAFKTETISVLRTENTFMLCPFQCSDGTGVYSLVLWISTICLSYAVNTNVGDGLALLWTKASTAMVVSYYLRNIPLSATKLFPVIFTSFTSTSCFIFHGKIFYNMTYFIGWKPRKTYIYILSFVQIWWFW